MSLHRMLIAPASRLSRTFSTSAHRTAAAMNPDNRDAEHFLAIPWCAALMNKPGMVRETAVSRFRKESTEDELFAATLHTENTIAAFLTLYKTPPPPPSSPSSRSSSSLTPPDMIRELKALLTLRSGVNGYPGVAHGGVVAAILDETIGLVLSVNNAAGIVREPAMTAYLNTQYLRPVETPQTVVCVANVTRAEGRKIWIDGRIEDKDGLVLASAESLYVKLKQKL